MKKLSYHNPDYKFEIKKHHNEGWLIKRTKPLISKTSTGKPYKTKIRAKKRLKNLARKQPLYKFELAKYKDLGWVIMRSEK